METDDNEQQNGQQLLSKPRLSNGRRTILTIMTLVYRKEDTDSFESLMT